MKQQKGLTARLIISHRLDPTVHREGHYGGALLGYAPLGFVAILMGGIELAIGGGVAAVLLAMVPDYDQRIPGITHRGITHTVWFAVVVGAVLGIAGVLIGLGRGGILTGLGLGVFAFLVGTVTICSHIAADALTPAGVEPLAPVDDRHITYDLARARNPLANYGLLVLGGAVATSAFAVGVALTGG